MIVLVVAGLACLVAAAAWVALPLGLAALGLALIFTAWASRPTPKE
jgi:hypothetical protein